MPPVGAAIAAAAVGQTVGAFIIRAVATVALTVGLNYLQRKLTKRPEEPDQNIAPAVGGIQTTISAGERVPRSFILGTWATAGTLVYAGSSGEEDGTPNAYLSMVIAISDIPVTDLVGLVINGEDATYDDGDEIQSGTFEGFVPIPEFEQDDENYLWVRFYDGTQNDVPDWMSGNFGDDPDHPYGEDRIGVGVAYALVVARVNSELFSGPPSVKFVVDGIKLYDPRADSTVGGSGPHRFFDPDTWSFTTNPEVMRYNILRGISYDGEWMFGLQNTDVSRLPVSDWFAAMNECEDSVALKGGGTEDQYRAGGEIQVSAQPAEVLENLGAAANSRLAEIGGLYKPHVGAAGASVYAFTDDDIISTERQTFEMFPSLADTINAVTARYVSPDEGWAWKDAPPRYSSSLEDEDNDRRLPTSFDYGYVSSATQVQRLMVAALNEARRFRRHVVVLPPEAWVLEPLDFVSWSSDRNGYVNKLFRVDGLRDGPTGLIIADLTEVDPSDYDWDEDVDELPITLSPPTILRPAAQAIPSWTVTGFDNDGVPSLLLQWNPDVSDVRGVEYQVRLASTQATITAGQIDLTWKTGQLAVSEGLRPLTDYEARGRYIPNSDRPTSWSSWLPATTPNLNPWSVDVQEDLDAINADLDIQVGLIKETAAAASLEGLVAFEKGGQTEAELLYGVYINLGGELNAAALQSFKVTIQTGISDNADEISAVATALTLVNAGVGGNYAEGLFSIQAAASQSGADVRLAMRLRVDENDTFVESGLYGEIVSGVARWTLLTDQFRIANSIGGTLVQPFIVSGGDVYLQDTFIDGDLVVNGTIITSKVATGAITELDYDAPSNGTHTGGGTTVVAEVEVSPAGGPIWWQWAFTLNRTAGSGTYTMTVDRYDEGVYASTLATYNGSALTRLHDFTIESPGPNTYQLKLNITASDAGTTVGWIDVHLGAMAGKR